MYFKIKVLTALLFMTIGLNSMGDEFSVRDSQTGKSIPAKIVISELNKAQVTPILWQQIKLGNYNLSTQKDIKSSILQSQNNKFILAKNQNLQLLEVSAENYQSMYTYIEIENDVKMTTIYLDRIAQSNKKPTCKKSNICGYVYDKNSILPLSSINIELSNYQVNYKTQTSSEGFFMFNQEIPENATLVVSKPGYRTQIWNAITLKSSFNMVIDLEQGSGITENSMQHPLMDVLNNQVNQQWLKARLSQNEFKIHPIINEHPGGGIYLQPPASIRVGFDASGGSCCGSSCSTNQVYTLESYVQKGLDNEWIASWNQESLKAGGIPYRSYGAWHVLNPPYIGYDICAGPCCQAFENTSYTAAVNAVKATTGIMLEIGGELARSEYSAQNNSWDDPNDGLACSNNDLSCGDGSVGSPATGWPCLSDPSSLAHGCFGHGRGMSQWGTQFNALAGEGFADIVDFYYNANNNPSEQRAQYNTSPIKIDAITTSTNLLQVNQTFNIHYQIFNSSSESFGPIILGASLLNSTNVYSDSSNDDVFTLIQSGTSNLNRSFSLASNVQPGVYDLLTAVFLDVNNDNLITGADWALISFRVNNAITIESLPILLFKDSFE